MTLPMLFSINGFMGQWGAGPQADVGRYLSVNPVDRGIGVARWQPCAYNCTAFPLSIGVDSGLAELRRQRQLNPGPYLIASWSEGAIIAALFVKDELARGITDYKGGVSFGDPYRAAGQWAPHEGGAAFGYTTSDPGGAGIGGPRNNWVAPDNYHRYAHPGDIYTCCEQDESGDDQRIIFDFVLTQWQGAVLDLWLFASRMASKPGASVGAIIEAVYDAITFYGTTQQRPHQNYDPRPAQNYLAGIARTLH